MPNKISPDKHIGAGGGPRRKPRHRAQAKSVGQALDQLLKRQPLLAARAVQATENNTLIDAVRALLPADLAPHALAASQQRSQLLVTADGAVWSGRLRYAVATVLPALRRDWPGISSVRLRVGPT
jgi:hypothetical protein